MVGFRSSLFMVLAGVVVLMFLPAQPQPKLDLELVKTDHGLSVMRHEVTITQWRACVSGGGCEYQPLPGPGASAGNFPVTGIGAVDAHQFVAWAQKNVDPALRLPTLAEWYQVSGIPPYSPTRIFTDPRLAWSATYGAEGKVDPTLKASGGFGTNANGLADMTGNVWEWTSSCVTEQYADRCPAFFAAGKHEARIPIFVRDPSGGGCATGTPPAHLGLRLVK